MLDRILKTAALVAMCVPTLARAQTPPAQTPPAQAPSLRRDGAWELSLGAGVITIDRALAASVLVPMGIQTANPSRIAPGLAARIGYQFNRNIGLSLGAMAGSGSGATILAPFFDVTASTDINAKMNWFGLAGVGVTRFSTDNSAAFTPPQAVHETGSYGVHLGAGLRRMISQRVAIRLEGRMQWEKYHELDSITGSPAYNGFATLGLSYFMGGRVDKDADGDGVVDRNDRCANTARGARVDQNGCPLDGDRDGVPDGLDRCPSTPANTPVDANGCARDTDADGVADNIDRCPNTPANTRVDANGCPLVVDSDSDGVADTADRCPNSPAGSLVNAQGCPRDADGDGVTDSLDRCADTPPNTRVDANGCTVILDADNDGVPDARDRCPNSPTGRPVDSLGCTIIALPALGADQMILRVQFQTNTSTLLPQSLPLLDSIAVAINATPGSYWEVQGHTDNRGSADLNRRLSQARAQSVVDYLVRKGVARGAMVATGFGPNRTVAPNSTPEGRAQNRRVQLRRIPPPPTGPAVR